MQSMNTIGFPTGLIGATGGAPGAGADAGPNAGFAQTLGQVLGDAGGTAGIAAMPPLLAANDSTPAPGKTPVTMAQLLTTAAPATGTALPQGVVPPAGTLVTAAPAPSTVQARTTLLAATPLTATTPPTTTVAPAAPTAPVTADAALSEMPGGTPSAPVAKPTETPDTATELLADPNAPAPGDAEAAPPVAPKGAIPAKQGPHPAKTEDDALPADPADGESAAAPVVADAAMLAAAQVPAQAPVRPELAAKPQSSPSRQIGEVTTGARKADVARGPADPAQALDAADGKTHSAVAATADKAGGQHDPAGRDDRGQAPAFSLRNDAVPLPAQAATDPARVAPAPAAATSEPVVAARPGHFGQSMGVEIARKVDAGEDTLRVRLSPEHLGKVEVTLSFDDAGTLRATVRADSAHALQLLRQDAPDLGRALDQAGIRADAQSFRFESRDGGAQAQQQQQQQQQQGQQQTNRQLAGNDQPEATDAAYRAIRGDGQVDLLA